MLYKRDIINVLFVAAFPVYGIGAYVSAAVSPSLGYLLAIAPLVIILLFYAIDIVYRKAFTVRTNGWFFLMLFFLVFTAYSLFVALGNNLPDANKSMTIARSLMIIVPFLAFVVVHLYNDDDNVLPRLTFTGLCLLLLLNMVGFFVLGLSNETHSIEGRVNFPFLDGLYSGSCLLSMISLLLIYRLRNQWRQPGKFVLNFGFLAINLTLLFLTNSRLTILILLFVVILLMTEQIRNIRSIYLLSLFTLPILLSIGLLLYQVLSHPIFVSILQRVDVIDVTTFNGRAFLWEDTFEWLFNDQRGLIFGSGYRGHYFLDITSNVAKLWNEKEPHNLHLHSSTLEILVSQGLVGLVVFLLLFYGMLKYYGKEYSKKSEQGVFLVVVIFLLFVMQVDLFLYMESLGALIFAWLMSFMAISKKVDDFEMEVDESGEVVDENVVKKTKIFEHDTYSYPRI